MGLTDLLKQALEAVSKSLQPELLSPIASASAPSPTPDKTKTQEYWNAIEAKEAQAVEDQYGGKPAPRYGGRNPKWEQWSKQNPNSFQELLSGAQLSSEKYGVPAEMLMDIAGIEGSGRLNIDQRNSAGDIVEGSGQGAFQFEPGQSYLPENWDPYSATASADLAGQRISEGHLSNWGVPKEIAKRDWGKYWGSVDNPNNSNGMLTDLYAAAELNKYIPNKEYQFNY